jgi:outer membrane lipase/esterase
MNPTRDVLVVLGTSLLLAAQAAFGFTALYTFGDSLTDTKSFAANPPNYATGRFSNGPLWVEYLSPQLGFSYNSANNSAVAGSVTGTGNILLLGLLSQVNKLSAPANASSALFVAWSGGNDFLNNLGAGTNDASWSNVIVSAVNNISNAVNILYGKGARAMIVPNLPDIGKTPSLRNGYSIAFQDYVTGEVIQFNSLLAGALGAIRNSKPSLQILDLDVFTKMTFLGTNIGTYGFSVAITDALDDPALTDKSFTGPGRNYVFWDSVHPTTKSHALLANWFFETLAGAHGLAIAFTRRAGALNLSLNNLQTAMAYTVQHSTQLPVWTDSLTFKATNGSQTLPEIMTANPGDFFRVKY